MEHLSATAVARDKFVTGGLKLFKKAQEKADKFIGKHPTHDPTEDRPRNYKVTHIGGALVRKTIEMNSRPVGELSCREIVTAVERRGRRLRIVTPMDGWVSLTTKDGSQILRSCAHERKQAQQQAFHKTFDARWAQAQAGREGGPAEGGDGDDDYVEEASPAADSDGEGDLLGNLGAEAAPPSTASASAAEALPSGAANVPRLAAAVPEEVAFAQMGASQLSQPLPADDPFAAFGLDLERASPSVRSAHVGPIPPAAAASTGPTAATSSSCAPVAAAAGDMLAFGSASAAAPAAASAAGTGFDGLIDVPVSAQLAPPATAAPPAAAAPAQGGGDLLDLL